MQGTEAIKLLLDCQRAEIKRWHTVKTVPTASTEKPVYSNKAQVKERCNVCNKKVLMKDLRYHVFMCKTTDLEGLLSSDSDDKGLCKPAFLPRRMI